MPDPAVPAAQRRSSASLLVVSNAEAGTADGLDAAVEVLPDAEVVATDTPELLDQVLDRRGDRVVVVAGGDGSLHAVVAALHRRGELTGTVVGLVPLGTGNDFARGTGLPLDPGEAARVLLEAAPQPVDLIVDDAAGVVVNSVHVGTGAEASRQAAPWKRLGRVGYVVGALAAGLRPPTPRLRVTVDGRVVSERRTLQVAVGNTPYVGGGTLLIPDADSGDGRLDVMVSAAVSVRARAGYVLRLRRGRHVERTDVRYARGTTATVTLAERRAGPAAASGFYASADGEIQGPLAERTWRVVPGAMSFLLPHPPRREGSR